MTSDVVAQLTTALAGRYDVQREIGRGGMATVYLARDIRHNRNVALKVLNPELGAILGVERFLAEIQVTANLQHPNLLPLFDSGEVGGMLFYVMPYVEGESLRARLGREKQLPVDESVRIAAAIAHALDYAHRHQVIHRDLKPENILMHEGQPLIADFGIALAVSNAGGARITQTGLSLGTPQYMSPEQATGDRVIDGRTDIYSLGAITHEMLVGDPPHVASTAQAVIAKVLTERATSVRASRPSVPGHVDAAVARALEKLAADRFATAREFGDALEGKGAVTPGAMQQADRAAFGRRRLPVSGAVPWVLVAVLAGVLAWRQFGTPAAARAPVIRARFDLPAGVRVNDALTGPTLAVSPQGDMIAFTSTAVAGAFGLFVRRTGELESRQVLNLAGRNLAFSPDGRWLAFTEGNVLKKVAIAGGEIATLGTTGGAVPYGLAWSPGDTIYIGSFSGMWHIPAGGGEARQVTEAADGVVAQPGQRWPILLPGGRTLAYVRGSNSSIPPRFSTMRTDGSDVRDHNVAMAAPLGVLDGHLVYVSSAGALLALPLDGSHRPTGEPVQLDEGVLIDPTAGAKAALSQSGTLMYLRGRAQFLPVLARSDTMTAVPLLREPGTYSTPRFSPDGNQVAIAVFGANATDIWIYDTRRNTFTKITTEGTNVRPEWSGDGRHVIFVSQRGEKVAIWRQRSDGSAPAELLYEPEVEPFEAVLSPDSRWLVVRTAPGARYPRDILLVSMDSGRAVTPLVAGPYTESMPRISPDGKWLVYHSNESGRFEVYVRPFPGRGARVQVSDNGGTEPVWGRSGRSLFYRAAHTSEIVEVQVTTGADFSIGQRRVVLRGDYLTDASHANYDVAPDGRFLMLKRAGEESQTIIVHNFGREVREKTTRP